MQSIISVELVSKCYTIAQLQRHNSLRDALADFVQAPFRRQNGKSEKIWALRDVSFEVARGEVVGVIGRNGAGKSTLLKILSRVTEPSNGRVELHGRVGSLLEVGTGFHSELTGRENIFLNGAILGMSREEIKRKFDEIVAFAETEQFLDTPVKHYSSGMLVRLAFAVAAHLEPEILIIDEVLAVGDVSFQKKCLGKMDEVAGYFTEDVVYWCAGRPPLGGEWRGRDAVIRSMSNREQGLGAADWGYEDVERTWYDADDRVIVEIRERSWLKNDTTDVMDQRTCVVLRFRGERICEMRDYTDSHTYEEFLKRHRKDLPKFNKK